MPLLIPIFKGEPLYNERVKLEDRDYIFRFDWAGRESRFYMSISDSEGVLLLSGVKLVANWPLLIRHRFNAALPPGEIFAFDFELGGIPPVLEDFGTRVQLYYYQSGEDLIALAAAEA